MDFGARSPIFWHLKIAKAPISPPSPLPPAPPTGGTRSTTGHTSSDLLCHIPVGVSIKTTKGHLSDIINLKNHMNCKTFISANRRHSLTLCKDFQTNHCDKMHGHFSWQDNNYVHHYCVICYEISGGLCLDHAKCNCIFYERKQRKTKKWAAPPPYPLPPHPTPPHLTP